MNRAYAVGYSTCGFASRGHLPELLRRLAGLGYEGVELELCRDRLHPHRDDPGTLREVKQVLRETGLRIALGTGGRHVLSDVRHHPGIVSHEACDRRVWGDFAVGALRMAAELEAECVMIHSGYAPPGVARDEVFRWMQDGLHRLVREAEACGQRLALEWHPSMFVRTMSDMLAVLEPFGPAIGCTLDVGHAHCTEDISIPEVIELLAERTYHVQLEDHRDRVHRHLMLGEGELDFPGIFEAFTRTGFDGIVALEFNAGDMLRDDLAEEAMQYMRRNLSTELGWT